MFYAVYEPIKCSGRNYGAPGEPFWVELADQTLIGELQSKKLIGRAYPQPLDYLPPIDADSEAAAPVEQPLEEPAEEQPVIEPVPEQVALLDVNTATRDELQSIPGIGRATAAAIIANRPYTDLEALRSLSPRVDWDSVLSQLTIGGKA